MTQQKYEKLYSLLKETQSFPCLYTHKVIGRHTQEFKESFQELLAKSPALKKSQEKLSKNNNHLSVTFILQAHSAEEIIRLYEETEKLIDLVMIL